MTQPNRSTDATKTGQTRRASRLERTLWCISYGGTMAMVAGIVAKGILINTILQPNCGTGVDHAGQLITTCAPEGQFLSTLDLVTRGTIGGTVFIMLAALVLYMRRHPVVAPVLEDPSASTE